MHKGASMAQSVERIHGKDEVAGPIPARSSIFFWVWRSLVARLNGVQEAGSSNLLTQTKDLDNQKAT